MVALRRSAAPLRPGRHHDRTRRQYSAAARTGGGIAARAPVGRCRACRAGGRVMVAQKTPPASLQKIQDDFQAYILAPLAAGSPLPIADAVRQQYGLSAEARLAIYHRAYRARLREAL